MRFSTIAVVAFTGFAAAQSELPVCAQPCIAASVAKTTTCAITDLACQCIAANKLAIQTDATTCVLTACADKALEVLAAADASCKKIAAGASTSASASASSSAATSTVATITGSISVSIIEETTSSTTILAPTGSPSPKPIVSNSTVTTASGTTSTSSRALTTSATRSASASASATVPAGGAGQLAIGSVGGVLAFAFALFAGL